MKNLVYLLVMALMVSCNTQTAEAEAAEERSIGFNTFLPEYKWHLGTEQAIDVVKKIDVAWAKKEYDAMRPFLSDTAKFYFADGRFADSPDGFIEILSEDDDDSESTWTFDYAFSVDLNPETGGEHVQAGFTGTEVKDSVEVHTRYHESYYIIEGKVVTWNQYDMDVKKE
jgi:hypothetical protein